MCSYELFGEDFRLQKLSELGNSLKKLNKIVDCKEKLAQTEVEKKLFHTFNKKLKEAGIIQNEGFIVDITFKGFGMQYIRCMLLMISQNKNGNKKIKCFLLLEEILK